MRQNKKHKDYIGHKFNKLTILDFETRNKKGYFLCECDCKERTEKWIRSDRVVSGEAKSCGCEYVKNQFKKEHGKGRTRLAAIWRTMIFRCYNKKCEKYKDYGGRGISICGEWKDDFINFYNWSMENGYEDNLTIDRIDVDGNYEPSNCRWITNKEQSNNKRNNTFVTINGETHTIAEWGRFSGISQSTISQRIRSGWAAEKLLQPARKIQTH